MQRFGARWYEVLLPLGGGRCDHPPLSLAAAIDHQEDRSEPWRRIVLDANVESLGGGAMKTGRPPHSFRLIVAMCNHLASIDPIEGGSRRRPYARPGCLTTLARCVPARLACLASCCCRHWPPLRLGSPSIPVAPCRTPPSKCTTRSTTPAATRETLRTPKRPTRRRTY